MVVLTAQLLNHPLVDKPSSDGGAPVEETGWDGVKHLKQIQKRLPLEQIMELVRQYEAGAPARELAKTFGVNESTVYAHLRRQGANDRPYRKLHGKQLEDAIRLHHDGMSVRAIATELKLDKGTVAGALREMGLS